MATQAKSGIGVTFERENDGTSGLFTALAEGTAIAGPTMQRAFIETTSLDSTGGYREFIAGFRDAGEVRVQYNYSKTVFDQLNTDFNANAAHTYRIVIPNVGNTLTFDAFMTQFPLNINVNDQILIDSVYKVSGAIAVTATP